MILADGRLAVLGRGDAGAGGRVKIRGKLVDLAGVEEALEDHPLVEACACVARALSIGVQTVSGPSPDASPPASLVAFVKRRRRLRDVGTGAETEEREEGTRKERREENDEDGEEDGEEEGQLRAWLADRLPRWSVPARIVFVDGIPLTAAAASSAPKRDMAGFAVASWLAPAGSIDTSTASDTCRTRVGQRRGGRCRGPARGECAWSIAGIGPVHLDFVDDKRGQRALLRAGRRLFGGAEAPLRASFGAGVEP